jgi:hypothetical protein
LALRFPLLERIVSGRAASSAVVLRSRPTVPMLRAVFFLCCAAFIVLAPAYVQVLGNKKSYLPRWEMFSLSSLNIYGVKYETAAPDGTRRELDRFQLLGYERPETAPRQVRFIKSPGEARAVASLLCNKLGPGAVLYMQLLDARRSGWRVVDRGTTNVCTP